MGNPGGRYLVSDDAVTSLVCLSSVYLCPSYCKVPNAVTPAPGSDPDDQMRVLEVNIQLPDGPPPVHQGPPPGAFQVLTSGVEDVTSACSPYTATRSV